jgi:hypothetical protein
MLAVRKADGGGPGHVRGGLRGCAGGPGPGGVARNRGPLRLRALRDAETEPVGAGARVRVGARQAGAPA